VLAYAPLIERRLRFFRKPHCGSIRIDETYIKIRGQWRYLPEFKWSSQRLPEPIVATRQVPRRGFSRPGSCAVWR